MTSTLESYHYKIGIKLDCLETIANAIDARDSISAIERIRINYIDGVSSALAGYYKSQDSNQDTNPLTELYMKFVAADNTIEKMDQQYTILDKLYSTYDTKILLPVFHPDPTQDALVSLARDLESIIAMPASQVTHDLEVMFKTYKDHQIAIAIQKLRINICSVCNSTMTLFPDTSEMRCDSPDCGQIITLYGIVFEDSQFYNQQTICTKSKKYDPNGHLSKWIDKIQAKEDYQFPQEIITAIDDIAVREFTRDGRVRPMTNLKCETVRKWLQHHRFTDAYDHAPLLRKIISSTHGHAIVPPELTPEERQDILVECSLSLREFGNVIRDPDLLRRLEKDRVRNKFYYPYVLWQIINLRIKDERKRRKLLECIHLQSDKTLRNNDIIWKVICEKRGYRYTTATNI